MGAFVYILQCADGSYYVGSARGDNLDKRFYDCLLYTSPSPRDLSTSRMPSSA